MGENKNLVLFTGEFPYGKRGEPFLNTEIQYLAKHFNSIYVLPSVNFGKDIRKTPNNVFVKNVINADPIRIRSIPVYIILKSVFFYITQINCRQKNAKYFRRAKDFIYLITQAYLNSKFLKQFMLENEITKENTLFYTYWFDNSLLSCSFLKREGLIDVLISRAHRFDLYDEYSIGGIVPFRQFIFKQVDRVYLISKHGYNYLSRNVSAKSFNKLRLSYLGVEKHGDVSKDKSGDNTPTLVSCSRVVSFKRVLRIVEVLKRFEQPLRWVHFGDGESFGQLQSNIKNLPEHISVYLMGQLDNEEIIHYYTNNFVNVFVSASESEGLPVTMMEAQSFGIPIVSFNVGGVSEIVLDGMTGFLIDNVNDFDGFALAIKKSLEKDVFNRDYIRKYYENNFNSSINYDQFATEISCLLEK